MAPLANYLGARPPESTPLFSRPTGGLPSRLLALHWMQNRPTSWLTDMTDHWPIVDFMDTERPPLSKNRRKIHKFKSCYRKPCQYYLDHRVSFGACYRCMSKVRTRWQTLWLVWSPLRSLWLWSSSSSSAWSIRGYCNCARGRPQRNRPTGRSTTCPHHLIHSRQNRYWSPPISTVINSRCAAKPRPHQQSCM